MDVLLALVIVAGLTLLAEGGERAWKVIFNPA